MKWNNILEYIFTGGGGIALLTLFFKSWADKRKDGKSAEQKLIEMLMEHEQQYDERANKQSERIDGLESEIGNLKDKIARVTASKNKIIAEKDKIERDLSEKISILEKENKNLKIKIKDLEEELNNAKKNV